MLSSTEEAISTRKVDKTSDTMKKSRLGSTWRRVGLDKVPVLTMAKGSIPPTIGIAIYQAQSISDHFGSVGFTIAVVSILCLCTMPRAMYLQTLGLNVCGLFLGTGISFLGLWATIEARRHTGNNSESDSYNGSASAVSAIFLFTNIYSINTLRAKYAPLQFPAIIYTIFASVVFTNVTGFTEMSHGSQFIVRLSECFLMAFALATVTSLFVLPLSSRKIVFEDQASVIGALRSFTKSSLNAIIHMEGRENKKGLQEGDMVDIEQGQEAAELNIIAQDKDLRLKISNNSSASLCQIFGKLHTDMISADGEWAWGKLDSKDLEILFRLMRNILLLSLGVSSINGIFKNTLVQKENRYNQTKFMESLTKTFEDISQAIDIGLERAGLILGLINGNTAIFTQNNLPTQGLSHEATTVRVNMESFSIVLERKMSNFVAERPSRLNEWTREFEVEATRESANVALDDQGRHIKGTRPKTYDRQVYIMLSVEELVYTCGMAVLALVKFVESNAENTKNRLIGAPSHVMKLILRSGSEHSHSYPSHKNGEMFPLAELLYPSDRDIEHLPPSNLWENITNYLRLIPKFFRSPESVFGFRVACATMSIGITAFLHQTQEFFLQQRLVWAMIMIAISMSWTSGQSTFGLLLRLIGTLIATINSLIIWYIVDGHTAGVISFLFFFIFLEFYFVIKFPRFVVIAIIAMVTQVLILGYELQVRKVGVKSAEASGQPYLPTSQLAPYRLACVTGGAFIAFFWSIFPYPITERSKLREELGKSIYLLAEYYSCVHAGMGTRFQGLDGDDGDPESPGQRLMKLERDLFAHESSLLRTLNDRSTYTVWDLSIGGKFPREKFNAIIQNVQNLMNHFALLANATKSIPKRSEQTSPWLNKLSQLLKQINPTSHNITSTLVLLSSAVNNGTALPPYLQSPAIYEISKQLDELDPDILSIKHGLEPGYGVYAVMQVTLTLVSSELEELILNVKDLVGEVKFSSHINDSVVLV